MNSDRRPRTERLLAVLLLVAGGTHALAQLEPLEDAYITYRYAEHFAAGQGLVYNAGERVEGCTSIGWTLLLAVFARLRMPLPAVSHALSLACGLWLAWLTLRLAQAACTLPTAPRSELWAPLLLMASGTWAYYAGSGMEATAFAAALTGTVLLLSTGPDPRRAYCAGALLALAAMLRPEGAGYALAILAAVLAGSRRRDAWRLLAPFLALYLPFFCARYWYFGHWLPNTYYAKAAPSRFVFWAGVAYAEAFATSQLFALQLLAALSVALTRFRERHWRMIVAVMLAALANAILVGGDAFAYFRLFLPAMPCAAVASLEGTRALLEYWGRRRNGLAVRGQTLLGGGVLAFTSTWLLLSQFVPMRTLLRHETQSEWRKIAGIHRIDRDYFLVAEWLKQSFPPNTLLAINAAGIVPYLSGLRTLDMLGLNDEHIAHRQMTLGLGANGHEKHDAAYVLSRKPDIILLGLPTLAPRFIKQEELEYWVGRFFRYLPGDRELYYSQEFRRSYVPVSVAIAGRYLVFFRRMNTQ